LFQWSALCARRCLSRGLILCALLALVSLISAAAAPLWGQEAPESGTSGTIQGTVLDEDGNPVEGARVTYTSQSNESRGSATAGKDGTYVSEQLPATTYLVVAEGRDMLPGQRTIAVTAGGTATANFHLAWINPGPVRLQSQFTGDAPEDLPINGRNYLTAGEIFPGVQAVDGAVLDPGKSGFQTLSIDSSLGRTTRYDFDEIESMDETKGAAEMNLPAEGVREVVVYRELPEPYQSLNAEGSVRVLTRSGSGEEWHGNIFGNFRDQSLGLAGFPDNSDYSRQQYGFGAGGALIKDKAFLFVSGERSKQDGLLPTEVGFPAPNGSTLRDAFFRENMLLARLDYSVSDNMKFFVRLGYDNANQIGPQNSFSSFRNQLNVPSAAFGVDWDHGRFLHSARFGIQKMVNAVNPDLGASLIDSAAPFHIQFGSFGIGPSIVGPRQTVQRDLFGRYDSITNFRVDHAIRFGAAIHRISQGDFFDPGVYGPSVTSSNGLATISAIDGNPLLSGGAENPLNYPVGTVTIFNGLGNFSENSAFNRPTGGHNDTRLEGYFGDRFNAMPNLNIIFGLNYVYDTNRTDSDLSPVPCSALNPTIVTAPPCTGNNLVLNQFGYLPPFTQGLYQPLGNRISHPYNNFAPQLGVAWDPGHNGRTVVRVGTGIFFDNFLLQNTYQDRINRLSNGQYNRSLTLCPVGSTLLPNAIQQAQGGQPYITSSVDGLDIATQICGQPLGSLQTPTGGGSPVEVATAIQDLQTQFQAAQAATTSGPNVYSLANSMADFGGMLAPTFRTPRIIHMSGGIERQMGVRSMFSVDYMREIGTQLPLGIDSNHAGGAAYLTDGVNPNAALNTYAAELSAINDTVVPYGCPAATSAGGSSQAAVTCYLATVPTASITDFARNGLDSSNSYCGPFPCSVLNKHDIFGNPQQASFGGINPAVGPNIMYFPSGRSQYQALHATYHTSSAANPMHHVQKIDLAFSYTLSRYRTNIAAPNGSGGDYSTLTVAQDYDRPHLGHFGSSGLDRTHQIVLTPTVETPHGPRISMILLMASPLPLTGYIPQLNGGGVAGEIFRSDVSGDGTVGDIVNGTFIGSTGKYTSTKINQAIAFYNHNVAGQLTPAGNDLVGSGLFSATQMHALGAYAPLISSCNPPDPSCGVPGRAAEENWLKTIDLRLNWPFALGERFKIEPNFAVFNVFNLANFGGPGGQLSGILDGAPGTSLNNSTSPGVCGNSTAFCTSRLDRVLPGSGTYANGAPRQLEFGVRITF
jgi:hypothetical protein